MRDRRNRWCAPAGPAAPLWRLLINQPPRPDREVREADARKLTAWLPEQIRERAFDLLRSGKAIPQEALRCDVLASLDNE